MFRFAISKQSASKKLLDATHFNRSIFTYFRKMFFSTLDANQGFHQISLDEHSLRLKYFLILFRKFRYVGLTIRTGNGPEEVHCVMVETLTEIIRVKVYIDTFIDASSLAEHDRV